MKKILITGANGFIGSHLIDYCISKDYEIYALERPNQIYNNLSHFTSGKVSFPEEDKQDFLGESIRIPTVNKKLIILECDVKNSTLLEKILIKVKPKFLFHFAAQPYIIPSWEDPVDTIETNVVGTINIFESIKKSNLKIKVIVACSSTEYGTSAHSNKPLKETDPLLAMHPYGISKISAELLARQYFINFGIEIVNLRFFNQTGTRRVNDAPSDFIRKVAQIELGLKDSVIQVGNLNPYRDFTDIKDSVEVIWLAAIKGKPGESYNVCSSKKIQIRRLLDISIKFSTKKIMIKENVQDKLRKSDEDVITGDNTKIKNELGWQPSISIEATLKEMFDYWINYYKKVLKN
ncbi:MAG: GDP-mannose 4,6-dehydratase [Promethearchaeota archaeon]|jgi:GDP-mannose 4,6-dehydratase